MNYTLHTGWLIDWFGFRVLEGLSWFFFLFSVLTIRKSQQISFFTRACEVMISWHLLGSSGGDSSFPSSSRHTQRRSKPCCHAQTTLPVVLLRVSCYCCVVTVVVVVVWCFAAVSCAPLPGFRCLSPLFSGGCSCFIPPPSRPTWLMRQAVLIDVTRLGFVHKIFLQPHPTPPNQLAAVLELLNEQTWNEFAIHGAICQGQPFWGPH